MSCPRALHRFAPFLGDVGINTGYEATKAGIQGGDVGQAAGAGAVGCGIGHGVGGFLSRGVTPMLGAAQRKLAEAGVPLTPGQMGGRLGNFMEDLASNLPFTGSIDRSRRAAIDQYSRAEVNKALAPIGQTTKALGEDAVAQGKSIISNAYNHVKQHVFVPPQAGMQALQQAQGDLAQMPMLDVQQAALIDSYVRKRIAPHFMTGQPMDGPLWKSIDRELGDNAQRFRNSSDPTHKLLGDAYKALQERLRDALQGKVAGAVNDMQKLNASRRAMYPIEDASEKAAGRLGRFNPTQLAQSANKMEQSAGT